MLKWFRSASGGGTALGKGLPCPSGPYTVGFVDYEWVPRRSKYVQEPPSYVLARIYYPSAPATKNEEADLQGAPNDAFWKGRSYWIPSPAYYPGYGYYLKMPWYISSPLFRMVAGNTPIWAVEKAPILENAQAPMPLVIFSHGLAGIRTTYSTLCTDLASHGFIVAAIEHRDGSASMTVMPKDETVLQYQHPPEDDQAAYVFRAEQLAHRRQEVSATIDLFMNEDVIGGEGEGVEGAVENLWRQTSGREYSDRKDLIEIDPLPRLREGLLKGNVGIMGHSFGAATSFLSSQQDPRISSLVAFDPWMFPLSDNFATDAYQKHAIPMLAVNSSIFHWPANLKSLRETLERNGQIGGTSVQVTIADTRHMDQSDFPILVPAWLASRFRSQPLADPRDTLRLNTKLSLAFHQGALRQIKTSKAEEEPSLAPFQHLLWGPQEGGVKVHSPEARLNVNIKIGV